MIFVMKNDFSTLNLLKFTKCFSFYRIRKVVGFLLEARFNYKITLIRTNAMVTMMATMVIMGKG